MDHLILVLLSALLVSILILLLYAFWKIRAFHHLMVTEVGSRLPALLVSQVDKAIRQIEDLVDLSLELKLTHSLPVTDEWAMRPDILRELTRYVRQARPALIVECGSGVSTVVLARCAQLNKLGHIYSLEHLPEYADRTTHELARHGLTTFASVLIAPLQPYEFDGERWSWYTLDDLPADGIDMLVIDGPPGETCPLARYPAGPLMFGRLSPQAVVILDDTFRNEERQTLQRWAKEFPVFQQEHKPTERGCVILRNKRPAMTANEDNSSVSPERGKQCSWKI